MDYNVEDLSKIINTKYTFEYSQNVHSSWSNRELRHFNLEYCRHCREFIRGVREKSGVKPDIFWMIYNLEALGKPKMAELMYFWFIKKGLLVPI